MGNYILCQQKRADIPYYIENISTNIFSIEELCFYLYHNIYLLDETIIGEELCLWLKEELGMRNLGLKLSSLLKATIDIGNFILPIFKEAHYLSPTDFKEISEKLQQLQEQPQIMRQKLKGDYLVRYGKYMNGIKVYQKTLESVEETNLGGQFKGSVFHNMGCAYAKLFQMDEALVCLQNAYEHLHSKAALKSYLYAIYIARSPEEYENKAKELGVDEQTRDDMAQELKENNIVSVPSAAARAYQEAKKKKEEGDWEGYYGSMDIILEQMTKDYHKNTGL